MPTFTVQEGYDKRAEIEIKDGENFIGRELDCWFVIESGDVSRHHARVVKEGNKVFIQDNGSRNGTFLNSSPVNEKHELKHMDVVQIGRNVFVYNDSDISMDSRDDENLDFSMKTAEYYNFEFIKQIIKKIEGNIGKVFKGKPEVIRNVLVCLFADGHLLVEDSPGVGKSVLAQCLAKSIQGDYRRIQFTPDMLPSDITGINVYNEKTQQFSFIPGPIFGNVILADEINRTTPRTQSSLLECMSESVITIDGKPHVLQKPFFVIATQNPSDYHGTYPLPEPQLDRFLMRTSIGYPDKDAEKEILSSQIARHPLNDISYVVSAMEIVQCHALVRQVFISDAVKDYIVNIAEATREHPAFTTGCSPRASLALMRTSQSLAAYYGRQYVIPKDVRELVIPVLSHRVSMKIRAQGKWEDTSDVLTEILESIPLENEE